MIGNVFLLMFVKVVVCLQYLTVKFHCWVWYGINILDLIDWAYSIEVILTGNIRKKKTLKNICPEVLQTNSLFNP